MRRLVFFCFLLLGHSGFSQQDFFEQALGLIQKGSIDQAIPLLEKAAEAGQEPQAAFYLSQACRSGNGVAASDSLADVWLLKSAKQGYAPAYSGASSILLNPKSPFQDSLKGIFFLKTCAAQKQPDCQLRLARLFLSAGHKKKQLDSALVLLKSLACQTSISDQGELLYRQDALENLFDLYSNPASPVFNEVLAASWFLIWTMNMSLSQEANRELYFGKGKKWVARLTEAKAQKALQTAEGMIAAKIELPEELMKKKSPKP